MSFRRIAVYCGSSGDVDPLYLDSARRTGALLADRGIEIVFGGGRVGMMGACADAALAKGGTVIGVIPHKLVELEVGHAGVTELLTVDSMHARKMLMASLSDAFIALPGGFGTMDELMEVTTWNQLGYHKKPAGVLNVEGYFDHLLAFIEHAADVGFVRPVHRGLLVANPEPEGLLAELADVELPDLKKWMDRP